MPATGGPPPWLRRTADGLLAFTAAAIPLSTTGMEAGVVALAVLAVVAAARGWSPIRRTPLDGVLATFFAVLALSTLASGRPGEAAGWLRLWPVLTYFAVFWWCRTPADAGRFVRLLVAAAAVAGAYGILQHYTGADWYRALLGRQSFVRPREAGDPRFAVVGFFRNYLTFAHTMAAPFAHALALARRGAPVGLVAAPLVLVAIVFSTGRGAWLAVVAASVVVLGGRRGAGAGRGLAILAVGALVVAATPSFRDQALGMFSLGGENTGRVAIYRANLAIIRDHPWLGLGFGRYATAATPYYDAEPLADRRSHAHNNFLQLGAEAGLLGLAAFCLVYAHAIRLGVAAIARAPDDAERATAAGAVGALVAFLVGGLTQYTFGDAEVVIAMWSMLAVAMACVAPAG